MLHANHTRSSGQFFSANLDVTCMASAECTEQAVCRVASLQSLSVDDLSAFFYSKDGQSEVKESISHGDESIRLVAIVGFGGLLLLAWERSLTNDVENFLRFSSLSEARRSRDDFVDFTVDILLNFSLGVIGRAAASDPLHQLLDSPICVQAYSEVLFGLFLRYNTEVLGFDGRVRSLLGIPLKKSTDDMLWLPILKKVTGGLLGYGGELLLVERWREMTWCYEYGRLLSQLFLFLLAGGGTGRGLRADKVLDYSTLEKGRAGECFESQFEGVSSYASVRVRKVAAEWTISLLLQCASISAVEAVAAIGEALSFSEPHLGLSKDFEAQICNCVIQHSIRLLRLGERATPSERTLALADPFGVCEEDTAKYIQSIRPRLISYAFIALRCPFLPDHQLSAVCYLLEVIHSMDREGDWEGEGDGETPRILLEAQGVSCAISPSSPWSACRPVSDTSLLSLDRPPSMNVKHRLQQLLSIPSALLFVAPTPRAKNTRNYFLTALCLCCEEMLIAAIGDANRVYSIMLHGQQKYTRSAVDRALQSLEDLTDLLSCVPLIVHNFKGCLLWEVDDRSGETAQLAYVSLTSAAAAILLPTASPNSSVLSDSVFAPIPTSEPTFPRVDLRMRSVAVELKDALGAVSLMLCSALQKPPSHVYSVGACVEWGYVSLMHHIEEAEQSPIQRKADELRLQGLVDLLHDALLGRCSRDEERGVNGSLLSPTPWPGGRSLGQPAPSSSDRPRTFSTHNAAEVLNMFDSLTIHASLTVANMCRQVVRSLINPTSSSTTSSMNILGFQITERVELLIRNWESSCPLNDIRGGHSGVVTSSARRPLECNIVRKTHADEDGQGTETACPISTSYTVSLIKSVFSDNLRKGPSMSDSHHGADASNHTHDKPFASSTAPTSLTLALGSLCSGAKGDDNLTWVQVSGSGDLLTVLVASSQPVETKLGNHNRVMVPLRVSVTNSAGFKVPAFSVEVFLLHGGRGRGSVCASPDAVLARTQQCGTASTVIGVDGLTEYMLPGSTLHKTFYVEVNRLCGIDAVVRLTYPDLALEDADSGDAFFNSPHLSSSAEVQGRGGGRRAGSIVAETDCASFHISVMTFLGPLFKSLHALEAVRVSTESSSSPLSSSSSLAPVDSAAVLPVRGVSGEVFMSLKHRLPFSAVIETHLSDLESVDRLRTQWEVHGIISSSDEARTMDCPSSSSGRTWAMESLWGCEVAVSEEAEWSDARDSDFQGNSLLAIGNCSRIRMRLRVWCSDSASLSAILRDRQHFMGDLLGS